MNEVESIEHSFMVQNIKEELLKIGGKVETYTVQKSDIIFTNKIGEQIAIEVETGKGFKKFEQLENNYSGKVTVVLTNSDYKKHYQILFKDKYPVLTRKDLSNLFRTLITKKE